MKLLTAFLITLFVFSSGSAQSAQNDADYIWTEENYLTILSELMPLDGTISFRTYKDLPHDSLEYSCTFRFFGAPRSKFGIDKTGKVNVTVASGVSIYNQLMKLRQKNRRASAEQLKKLIDLSKYSLDEYDCPEIQTLYDKFYDLQLPLVSANDKGKEGFESWGIMHPQVYDFRAVISGGELNLQLQGSDHEFVKWANDAKKTLNTCISTQK